MTSVVLRVKLKVLKLSVKLKATQVLKHKDIIQKIHVETHQHRRPNSSIRFSRPGCRIRAAAAAASPAAEISETLIHKITVRFIAMMKRVPADRRNRWIKKRTKCGTL